MQPVEINAGSYYLRQLRADDRIDDRPALVAAFADVDLRKATTHRVNDIEDASRYIEQRAEQWAADRRCSWAIAQPVTGELVGEVGLTCQDVPLRTAEASCWVAPDWRGQGVAPLALGAALRFGYAALGLCHVDYAHAPDNAASGRVAAKCGFVQRGRRDGLVLWRQYP